MMSVSETVQYWRACNNCLECMMGITIEFSGGATAQRATLAIVGLGQDGGGALAVEQALRRLPGVRYAYVCAATEMAYIVYDSVQVDPNQFVVAVEQLGLQATEPELR
jgi:hypothetical protein